MSRYATAILNDMAAAELRHLLAAMVRDGMPVEADVLVVEQPDGKLPMGLTLQAVWGKGTPSSIREAEQEVRIETTAHAHEHYAQMFEGMATMGPVQLEQFVKQYASEERASVRAQLRTHAITRKLS